MQNEYRYQLDKGSKKHYCPECGKRKLVRYVDNQTGEYLPQQYGRCDRESKCSYHLNPYADGYNRNISGAVIKHYPKTIRPLKTKEIYYIPQEVLNSTLQGYETNCFIQNLLNNAPYPFDREDVEKVIAQYYIGSIMEGYCKGATTFPFIDRNNNVRAIQTKLFDKNNHTIKTSFLHSIFAYKYRQLDQTLPTWLRQYESNDLKVSCLFGEHLLNKYPNNPIALVEAPKTAIYGTLYFGFPRAPTNLIWLAVYNLSSLNADKCKALENRSVFLFPDLSTGSKAFLLWTNRAKELSLKIKETRFVVSDFLEQFATESDKAKGLDLADYLIQQDWRAYRQISE